MRIVLVGPEREENLSLRYLSSPLLAAGHDVEIARFDTVEDFGAVLRIATTADAVGLSMCYQARAREFLSLAQAVRAERPRIPIVAGGHYATCAAEELLLNHRDLDVIVLHEGEQTLVELANSGFHAEAFPRIAGLAFRLDDRVQRTPPRPKQAILDAIAFPDRRGPVRRLAGVSTAYVMGSRGCLSSCEYCCITTLHRVAPGPRFRQRSVENIADEMAELYWSRDVRQYVFHDDNFLVPSVEKNLSRLDELSSALSARSLGGIGFTIKCRPSEAHPEVFKKLKEMGLLRVFLGIESASTQGLKSIGRCPSKGGYEGDLSSADDALSLCRKLGISAQYTLMCFHPDATLETVRADIDFFRRHIEHPLNFCRVETYAGTPLEARMRAERRSEGDYLARTYQMKDSCVAVASRLASRIFERRCWQTDSLMEKAIGLEHLASVVQHFYRTFAAANLVAQIRDYIRRVNLDLVEKLSSLIDIVEETFGRDESHLILRVRELIASERASMALLLGEGKRLEQALREVGIHNVEGRPIQQATSRRANGVFRTAMSATLAAALWGCDMGGGVSEYAPPPLSKTDTDGDGLWDQCETELFQTDPNQPDSDRDGVSDANENHDNGSMTNLEEQRAMPSWVWTCEDVSDPGPRPRLSDSDSDGLPDECETTIFHTDPKLKDTDGDGTLDGDEDHDGLGMTNIDEQTRGGAETACTDYDDSKR